MVTPQIDMTNETHVLVDETREAVCQPHIFSVTAMNEAGNSSASTIMDSIPICETIPHAECQYSQHYIPSQL